MPAPAPWAKTKHALGCAGLVRSAETTGVWPTSMVSCSSIQLNLSEQRGPVVVLHCGLARRFRYNTEAAQKITVHVALAFPRGVPATGRVDRFSAFAATAPEPSDPPARCSRWRGLVRMRAHSQDGSAMLCVDVGRPTDAGAEERNDRSDSSRRHRRHQCPFRADGARRYRTAGTS